ncbi:class I SAM-dependent methyltransferase [Novipirellula artificiosorum]|uniref:class I SAM-dependent methyltransferase n=1 Tax=Novipirellula artificiosorum TaxID=2528016 RepID=UPI0011B521D0|nr:class I SAM-dependent methyltransferase [Novipirellula artificiosorum]
MTKTTSTSEILLRVADELVAERAFTDSMRFIRLFQSVFMKTDLSGKSLLDVGCGVGALALGSAASGVRHAVGLEPEVDGSTSGFFCTGERLIKSLGFSNVSIRNNMLANYDFDESPFDVIVMYNVINHLNEEACSRILTSDEARTLYIQQLSHLREYISPGGEMLVADCARSNFFGDLGIRNPIAKTIEWQKHQNPRIWASIFEEAGFSSTEFWWNPIHKLRGFGRFARTSAIAYFTNSHFVLRAVK